MASESKTTAVRSKSDSKSSTKAVAPKTVKKTTSKAAAPAKTTAKVAATKTAPAKAAKPAAKKPATPRKPKPTGQPITASARLQHIEIAAYYIAEKSGFSRNPHECWIAAEREVDGLLLAGKL